MVALLALIVLSIVNYIVLPIIFQFILIGFRALLPVIRTALLNHIIPYMENRVQDSFINETFLADYRDWFAPLETRRLY